jgi:hypothetical protein
VIDKSYRTTTPQKKKEDSRTGLDWNPPPLSPLFLFTVLSCSDFDTTTSTRFHYSSILINLSKDRNNFVSNQSSKFFTGILKMGSKNGKPVLREEDLEDLARSSGLAPQEVSYIF